MAPFLRNGGKFFDFLEQFRNATQQQLFLQMPVPQYSSLKKKEYVGIRISGIPP
jgi:hypothetical protein